MTMQYIREHYGVPAGRGVRIKYLNGGIFYGKIVAAKGAYLRVRWDEGSQNIVSLHPTWCVQYLGASDNG